MCILICLFLEQYTISCSPGSIDDRMQSTANLQNMFKCVTPGMSPFRILYNLEVLLTCIIIRDEINVIKLVSLKYCRHGKASDNRISRPPCIVSELLIVKIKISHLAD